MCIFIIILLYASITVFQRKPVSRRSYYGKTRVFRVILLLPIEIGRIIFLPVDRCGEGDSAGDVEVVGEGVTVYLFGQAVVAGGEVEQADMAIDGGGAVGGYGAQNGGEAEVLGEWNLLPVAFSLALDGVLLSVVHIVVVGVNDPRLHHVSFIVTRFYYLQMVPPFHYRKEEPFLLLHLLVFLSSTR